MKNSEKTSANREAKLSEGEMELLRLLCEHGPSPLSQVHRNYGQKIGLTTIQTRLNRMVGKGVVGKSSDYPTLYSALVRLEDASKTYFELIRKICDDSIIPLMSHLTERRKLKPEEIALLKDVIARQEGTGKEGTGKKGGDQ